MNAVAQQDSQKTTTPTRQAYVAPEVNIFTTQEGYVLEAEMPGVNKNGLEVTLEGTELTLVGRRSVETPKGDALYRESREFDYRRVFELDPAIDAARISAKMEQGVLTLLLPKAEKLKPRKINIGE
jgi:HSP20 family protein